MKSIVSRSVEEGERGGRHWEQQRDLLWSPPKIFLVPTLPLPASFTPNVDVLPCQAPVCRYEMSETEIQGFCQQTMSPLVSPACPHPCLWLSLHPYPRLPHLSASAAQTKLQTWSGTKWRQWWLQSDTRICSSEVLKTGSTLCVLLIESDWEMLNRTLFTHHLVSLRSDWRNAVLQTRSKSMLNNCCSLEQKDGRKLQGKFKNELSKWNLDWRP